MGEFVTNLGVGNSLLSLIIPAVIITITVFAFRPLLRGYRKEVAQEQGSETRWAHLIEAEKRRSRAKWFIGVGYAASILWLVFTIASGSQRDAASTISALLLPVALVGINIGLPMAVKAPYAKGQTPSWRRIAMFTLILWAALLASFTGSGITIGLSAVVLAVGLLTLPTLLWFPVWVVVAFVKQRREPSGSGSNESN